MKVVSKRRIPTEEKSNDLMDYARIPEVPRCETACVFCQRKDWIEHRHKLNLFGQPPTGASQPGAAQEAAASSGSGAHVDNADEDPEQAQDYDKAGSLL